MYKHVHSVLGLLTDFCSTHGVLNRLEVPVDGMKWGKNRSNLNVCITGYLMVCMFRWMANAWRCVKFQKRHKTLWKQPDILQDIMSRLVIITSNDSHVTYAQMVSLTCTTTTCAKSLNHKNCIHALNLCLSPPL